MFMKILITGAYGQLGTASEEVFRKAGHEVAAAGRDVLDVADAFSINRVVREINPQWILNCAAYNNLERAPEEVEKAFALNAYAPHFLARSARENGARLVHVSTDYVFDGEKGWYAEADAPNPVNVYGVSKLAGEKLALLADSATIIVRTSWLYGSTSDESSHNFVAMILARARAQAEVRVVADQIGVPTYAPDLADAMRKLLESGAPGGVYHIVNSGACSRYEQTKKIFELAGVKTPLLPIATAESVSGIRRPASSILETAKINALGIGPLRDWQEALAEYLKNK